MITAEILEFAGLKTAIHAMRNPKNSWDKSDSTMGTVIDDSGTHYEISIGSNDMKLMQALRSGGVEHRTYMRMIQVWMDVTAPIYWWKEADRYTVGKNQIGCSTMHKIHAKEFTVDDFAHESLAGVEANRALMSTINALNRAREDYNHAVESLNTQDLTDSERQHKQAQAKRFWYTMIQLLPSSYMQTRTINMSYEVCAKMYKERKNHKLNEWHDFLAVLETLPYAKELIVC